MSVIGLLEWSPPATIIIHVAKLLSCSSVIVHSLVRRFEQTGISIDALSRGDVRKRRRDNTVNLLLRISVSSSSRQLWLLDASTFHTRRLETKFKANYFLHVIFYFHPLVIPDATSQNRALHPCFCYTDLLKIEN